LAAEEPAPAATPALDGYCSVTLVEQEKWVEGDPRWGVLHRGRTYLFAGPEEQRRFLDNFDRYAPALSGYDCVKYIDQGAMLEGKRAHGIFYRGQVFLFVDEASLQQFWQAPERYVPYVVAEQPRETSLR
jgi:protein disulfide-isomerase